MKKIIFVKLRKFIQPVNRVYLICQCINRFMKINKDIITKSQIGNVNKNFFVVIKPVYPNNR